MIKSGQYSLGGTKNDRKLLSFFVKNRTESSFQSSNRCQLWPFFFLRNYTMKNSYLETWPSFLFHTWKVQISSEHYRRFLFYLIRNIWIVMLCFFFAINTLFVTLVCLLASMQVLFEARTLLCLRILGYCLNIYVGFSHVFKMSLTVNSEYVFKWGKQVHYNLVQ